ncbi:MAG TPA: Stk1 family PASTA domain-containing Ser/Thr kinase [Actinomycetales bacterium]
MDATVTDPLVGRLLDGRYAVRSRIARGGMSTVYLAVDERLDREVAVKVMHPSLSADDGFVRRFIREARSAARLSHPGVVQVFDQGEDHGVVFLAMEHIAGTTLRDLMREQGALSAREALDVLEPVLDALAAAHRAGIVHRDVKPENVLLAQDGRVKVADFGLARLVSTSTVASATGVLLGTVSYLAPEQVERGIADARSDVYACGVLLFEMLTGSKPFDGETALQVAYQHVHDDVPAPSTRADGIAPELDDLVLAAAANDPDERPADALAMLTMLREARRELDADQLDARPVELPRQPSRRRTQQGERTVALPGTRADGRGASGATAAGVARLDTGELDTGELDHDDDGHDFDAHDEDRPRRRRGRLLLTLVLLLAVALGVGGWYVGAGPGAYTDVPPVTATGVEQARQQLTAAGLDSEVRQVFSEDVPAGQVMGADPRTRVRKGGTVTLTVSRGLERYAVPPVVGQPRATAAEALANNKLAVAADRGVYDEKVPQGRVVATDPAAGQRLRAGSPVTLVVSRGRQPIAVPGFVGKPAKDAEAALRKAGFTVQSRQEYDDTVPAGSVVSQQPSSGTGFRGTPVALVVSRGPRLVTVPNVVGRQVEQATATLRSQGFDVQVNEVLGGFFGTVRSQDAGAGAEVPAGSTITLTVV